MMGKFIPLLISSFISLLPRRFFLPHRERETRKQKVLAAKAYVSYADKELLGGTEEEWVDGNRKTFPIFALTETGLLRGGKAFY